MFLLDRAHAYAEKIIHDLDDFGGRRRARTRRPRSHIDEHDSDFFFDAAQSRVARKNAFRGASAYMQTEGLAQFFFVPEVANHLIEFTKQPAKFIRTACACATKVDCQITA